MDEFLERLNRLVISVTSPDGTVSVEYRNGTPTMRLRPGAMRTHTEVSLSRQLSAALTSVQRGYQHAMARIFEVERAGSPAPNLAETTVGRRKRAFNAAVAEVAVHVSSPRRLAEVRYSGADRMDVRLTPGVLGRAGVTASELLDDVQHAVAQASAAFDDRYRQIRRDHYERGLWKQEPR